MKFLMITYDNDSHISYFNMGTAYIAAAVRNAGHQVEIYSQDIYHYDEEHLKRHIDSNDYQIVGIGACGGYYQYRKIMKICNAINETQSRPLIILGGHLPTPDPEYFLRKFKADFVCMGEGEITTVELLDAIENKTDISAVKGIAYLDRQSDGSYNFVKNESRPLVENLDEIAMPAYDLFNIDHYSLNMHPNQERNQRSMSILSGRGCVFQCNFCYRMDKGFRPRSAESILREIKYLQDNYAISYICFEDELLMSSKERTLTLCRAFEESGLNFTWRCSGRLNFATKEVLTAMKKAGCVFINYGIESLDDTALRNMNKALTVKQIIEGIENTLSVGISPGYNIIFGNIGETAETLRKGVDFLIKYDDHAQLRTIRPVTPYPGSPLYYLAIEKGLIKDIADFYENKHSNSDLMTVNFTDLSEEEFYSALHEANMRLLDNYYHHSGMRNKEILDNLYKNRDASFRGFRKV